MLESWKLWLEFAADTTHSYDELLLDHLTGKVCRDGPFPNSSFLLNDCDHRHGELGYRFSENLERGFLFLFAGELIFGKPEGLHKCPILGRKA